MKFTLPMLTVALVAAVDCLGAQVAERDNAVETITISQLQCLEDGEGTPYSNCVTNVRGDYKKPKISKCADLAAKINMPGYALTADGVGDCYVGVGGIENGLAHADVSKSVIFPDGAVSDWVKYWSKTCFTKDTAHTMAHCTVKENPNLVLIMFGDQA